MTDSATSEVVGLRERKRRHTRTSLVSAARRRTLEHGLGGFTVDQLCDEVGISRRTFFNYFPSKEDAVLGHSEEGLPKELLDSFIASGDSVPPKPLLDGLTELFAEYASRMAITREEYNLMSAVLQREPHLITRMFTRAEAKSQLLVDLIIEREGLPEGHPAPRVITVVLGVIARRSLDEFFTEGNTSSYPDVIRRNIDALRYLFPSGPASPSPSTAPHPPAETAHGPHASQNQENP